MYFLQFLRFKVGDHYVRNFKQCFNMRVLKKRYIIYIQVPEKEAEENLDENKRESKQTEGEINLTFSSSSSDIQQEATAVGKVEVARLWHLFRILSSVPCFIFLFSISIAEYVDQDFSSRFIPFLYRTHE